MALIIVQSTGWSKVDMATLPSRDQTQITIYNSADLTLVKDSRTLTLKQGLNKLQLSWSNTLIDPTSLDMIPLRNTDRIDIQTLYYPPRVKDLGVWSISSRYSGKVPFEISYLTSGLSWRAFYMGTLNKAEDSMQLQGYVRVTNNSGEDYNNTITRLIVGKVNLIDNIQHLASRKYPFGRPHQKRFTRGGGRVGKVYKRRLQATAEMAMDSVAMKKEIKKESLSEYFLYTIEGKEQIPNGKSKRLPSFDVEDIPIENLYKFEEQRYGQTVMRFISFKNDKQHLLGETPIPGGSFRAFRNNGDGKELSYVGNSEFKYIPMNEKVELNLGSTKEVKVEIKLLSTKTDHYLFNTHGNIDGWDEIQHYRIETKNFRKIPIQLEVLRNINHPSWDLKNLKGDVEYEKLDIDTVKYKLPLKTFEHREFEYQLTIHHGRRRD